MMDYKSFRELVRQMRQRQREYFRSRSSEKLQEAKDLEREVDQELELGDEQQGWLFGE